MVSGVRRHGRAGYVGAGLSAVAIVWKAAASGHAEAKAIRMRVALSMTRAATLSSRRRSVANSAVTSAVALGISCSDAPHQPECGGVQDEAHLVGIGRAARGAVAGELALVQLDQVLGAAPRTIQPCR